MKSRNIRIRGNKNTILTKRIGSNVTISDYCFIGKDVKLGKGVLLANFVELNSNASVGEGTNIQTFCVINSDTKIGKYCHLGAGVLTADEKYMSPFTSRVERKPCIIGSYSKIGQGSKLVSVKIGIHSRIGAGSVVLKDVPPRQVWAGVPARYIRDVTPEELESDYP